MPVINYAIEINTEVTGSYNTSIGLTTDGYIRIITGRPAYNGSPTYPVWEDDSNNTHIWYQGIILDKGFSPPNRRIDIEKGGNYGTVSGFSFRIHNAMKFWKVIEDLDISILNTDITVFCVIDDKFYTCWSGIIENDPYEEIQTQIKCVSNYRKIHKTFPPQQIAPNVYPKAKKSSYGNPIPVCLGNIPYAQLFNITGSSTDLSLDYATGRYHGGQIKVLPEDIIYVCACLEYEASVKFDIITMRKSFGANQFANTYLTCLSGENAETEKLIQIIGNSASVWEQDATYSWIWYYRTSLQLASQYDINDTTFNTEYTYKWANVKDGVDKTWWFGIIDASSRHIVSNIEVEGFKKDDYGQYFMFNYDRDKEDMVDAHGLVTRVAYRNNRNSVELLLTDVNKDGTIIYMVPHGSKFYVLDGFNFLYLANQANASDMNKTSETDNILNPGETLIVTAASTPSNPYILTNHVFDLELLNFDLRDSEEIFIGIDLDVYVDSLVETKDVGIGFEFLLIDMYERAHVLTTNMGAQYTYEIESDTLFTDQIRWNFLPTDYYRNGTTGLAGTDSLFGELDGDGNTVKSYLQFPDELKDMIKKRSVRAVRLRLKISSTTDITISDIRLRQLGVFSYQQTKTNNNALFMKVEGGELRNMNDATYSVYDAIRHMIEYYDGIHHTSPDYGNIDTTRKWSYGWEIGRQITQQKNSLDYYKELCQFAFLGMFQKRTGNLKVTAFRELQSIQASYTDANIIKDSIKNFKKTSLLNCYNEYKLYWGYNPGSKKFDQAVGITNVDQTVFPDYLTSTEGEAEEISSPNVTNIKFYGDGVGTITFDDDVSGTLSIGDYITYYVMYGDSGAPAAEHVYFAYVYDVDTTEIKYKDAIFNNHYVVTGDITFAVVLKEPSGTPLWMTYVEGLKSYGTSRKMWEVCHYAYTKTKIVRNAPDNIMKSYWFNDASAFHGFDSSVIPTFSAPILYLQNLIEWTTLPKNQVHISIPVTSTNITTELLDYISFTDPVYTNDVTLNGWVTKIAVDMNNSKIDLELTLVSTYAEGIEDITGDGLIIETGDAPETISESGSQSDTITEG